MAAALAAGGLNNPVVYDRVGSGLSMSQLITDFGRTSNLVAWPDCGRQAQDQVTETTRAQILLETSRAYFALLRAQAVMKVAEQTVRARQLVADQVSALADSKMKSTFDVSFAKVNLSDAKLLQVQAQSDVKAGAANLATAMGLPTEAPSFWRKNCCRGPCPTRSRPDPRGSTGPPRAERPAAATERRQRFAKAEHALYYPNIGVVGHRGFCTTATHELPGRLAPSA